MLIFCSTLTKRTKILISSWGLILKYLELSTSLESNCSCEITKILNLEFKTSRVMVLASAICWMIKSTYWLLSGFYIKINSIGFLSLRDLAQYLKKSWFGSCSRDASSRSSFLIPSPQSKSSCTRRAMLPVGVPKIHLKMFEKNAKNPLRGRCCCTPPLYLLLWT